MTADHLHVVPDADPPQTVVAVLRDNAVLAHQRDVFAGLVVEHLVHKWADPAGGVDAISAADHQRLIDDARDHVWALAVTNQRAAALVQLGRRPR